jgi:hypothetical protein
MNRAATLGAIGLAAWTLSGAPYLTAATLNAATKPFAAEVERLSEPGGTFDTDNLISNERAYLEVIPALVSGGVTGGAYLGVGPDQNFSYIARIRPAVAYIIDVRRDNLLLHFLFKALFVHAHTRLEYLCLLTGRAPPPDLEKWSGSSLKDIVAHVDAAKMAPDGAGVLRRQLDETIESFGVPLSRSDFDTIDRFHRQFIEGGLGLQFHSFNRPPQYYYPTLRQLLLATDASGHMWNYLASEDDFQFLRALEGRDGVIPVVGDVAGTHAMAMIASVMAAHKQQISAFYISNVENYVFRDGRFPEYAANLGRLPRSSRSVMIRSIFAGEGQSVSVVQPLDDMIANLSRGTYRFYWDLVRPWQR